MKQTFFKTLINGWGYSLCKKNCRISIMSWILFNTYPVLSGLLTLSHCKQFWCKILYCHYFESLNKLSIFPVYVDSKFILLYFLFQTYKVPDSKLFLLYSFDNLKTFRSSALFGDSGTSVHAVPHNFLGICRGQSPSYISIQNCSHWSPIPSGQWLYINPVPVYVWEGRLVARW